MQATAAFTTSVQGPNGMAPQIRPRGDLNLTSTVVTNPYAQQSEFYAGAVQTGAIQMAAPRAAPGPVITPGSARRLPRPTALRGPRRTPYGIQINPGPRATLPPTR
jgi:hypothetical protein